MCTYLVCALEGGDGLAHVPVRHGEDGVHHLARHLRLLLGEVMRRMYVHT